jgi:hypothetical protein
MNEPVVDLNLLYQSALKGIHRAYMFMCFGSLGIRDGDFLFAELRGKLKIQIVPEPMPPNKLSHYAEQFRAWVIGNGLRELVEIFSQFLDEVYVHALQTTTLSDQGNRQKTFENAALRTKIRRLRQEMNIEGTYAQHFESLVAVRNALTHGVGVVRLRDCTLADELAVSWRGVEAYFVAANGVRYRIGDHPFGVELREPLETVFLNREKRWKLGERVELTSGELTEICFMANHEAIDILQSLREFGLRHNVTMKAATIIRGGS